MEVGTEWLTGSCVGYGVRRKGIMLVAVDDVAPPRTELLLQRIEQLEASRDDSSRRLHLEIDDLRRRLDAWPQRDIAVENIRFPPRVVVGIVASVLTIALGMYASTYGLRSDVRDILTTMASQKELADRDRRDLDRQYETLSKAIDTIDKQQKLQALETQTLKEMVLRQGVK